MQYRQQFIGSDDLPEDDIDRLFEKLEQIEPSPLLIASILQLAMKPPVTPLRVQPVFYDSWAELDGVAARNKKHMPC
jgi:hypothetical protein